MTTASLASRITSYQMMMSLMALCVNQLRVLWVTWTTMVPSLVARMLTMSTHPRQNDDEDGSPASLTWRA